MRELQLHTDDETVSSQEATEKLCGACRQSLPLEAYYRQADTRDGLGRWCKTCRNAAHAAYVAANREKLREARWRYALAHREQQREATRRYVARHREARREADRSYYHAHREDRREAHREAAKRYYRAHRAEILETARRRYAATRGNDSRGVDERSIAGLAGQVAAGLG